MPTESLKPLFEVRRVSSSPFRLFTRAKLLLDMRTYLERAQKHESHYEYDEDEMTRYTPHFETIGRAECKNHR